MECKLFYEHLFDECPYGKCPPDYCQYKVDTTYNEVLSTAKKVYDIFKAANLSNVQINKVMQVVLKQYNSEGTNEISSSRH